MTARKQRQRDALAALSLANLTFARTWNELLTYSKEQAFFFHSLPTSKQAAAAAVNVLLLSVFMYCVIRLMRKVSHRWGDRAAVLLLPLLIAPAFNSISGILSAVAPALAPQNWLRQLDAGGILALCLVATSFLYIGWRWPDWILKGSAWMIINLILLLPLEMAGVAWHFATDKSELYRTRPPAGYLPPRVDSPNVVILLIDELDYRLLFENRPSGLNLPEFDRLRSESLSASHAFPPGKITQVSVPSLLVGKRFLRTDTMGPDQLTGDPAGGGSRVPIGANDNIFASVRRMGMNTSVIGWYLPYCRLFSSVLSYCSWYDMGTRLNVEGDSFIHDLVNQAQAPYETATYSPFPQSVLGKHRIFNARGMERDLRRLLEVPNPGFVFIHHVATHAPYVYDRATKGFTLKNSPITGYVDGLAWADIVLGTVRQKLEEAGNWNNTILLVTADHSFRASRQLDGKWDPRVPWILKMPGNNKRIDYETPIHTIVTRRFVEAVVSGLIKTQDDEVNWLRANEASVYSESEH